MSSESFPPPRPPQYRSGVFASADLDRMSDAAELDIRAFAPGYRPELLDGLAHRLRQRALELRAELVLDEGPL